MKKMCKAPGCYMRAEIETDAKECLACGGPLRAVSSSIFGDLADLDTNGLFGDLFQK